MMTAGNQMKTSIFNSLMPILTKNFQEKIAEQQWLLLMMISLDSFAGDNPAKSKLLDPNQKWEFQLLEKMEVTAS